MKKRLGVPFALVLIFSLLVLVLVLSLIIPGCACPKEKHVIFTTSGWSGDWLTIYVPKILLEEELGYTTEIVDLSVPAIWAAIGAGEAHLWTDSWMPNQEDLKEEYIDTTEELGLIYGGGESADDICKEAWFIPKWVSEQYGITSATDLNDPEITKLFDTDGDGIGDVLGCNADWACAKITDGMIAGYGLEGMYEQKYGAEAMMNVTIEGLLKKNEPVLFYLYTPHIFLVKFPIGESVVILDDPKGYWGDISTVHIFGNKDWIEKNPEAAELLRQVKMTSAGIAWSMAKMEAKGDAPEALEAIAREWIAEHQAEVDSWLAAIK